jgi:hypothetical protein
MNRTVSVIFRAIPLVLAAVCFSFGLYVYTGGSTSSYFIAGNVIMALTAICYALFTTAATIIRQLIGAYQPLWHWLLPLSGYVVSAATVSYGLYLFAAIHTNQGYVAGHNVVGIGLVAACVTTVATTSRHFVLIPRNSHGTAADGPPPGAPSPQIGLALTAIPVSCALVAYGWALYSLSGGGMANFIGGLVLTGLAGVCASLMALVASVDRQIRNVFGEPERYAWSYWVIVYATLNLTLGLVVLVFSSRPYAVAPGFILIGLGLVCYSILSKVLLLALVWRRQFDLADRIPLIPTATCLVCLFVAAFLFEAEVTNSNLFIPARVLIGLGAVCFVLFSIVSVLEAGTSSPSEAQNPGTPEPHRSPSDSDLAVSAVTPGDPAPSLSERLYESASRKSLPRDVFSPTSRS